MRSWIYHGMLGNDAPEVQVGFTRGGLLLAIQGAMNAVDEAVHKNPNAKSKE